MLNQKKGNLFLALIFMILGIVAGYVPAATAATVPNVSGPMLQPEFWIDKLPAPDQIILGQEEIAAFNQEIIQRMPETVYDLAAYPPSLAGEDLIKLLTKRPFPEEERYMNGRKADLADYENLKKQMYLTGVGDKNEVSYGFTVKRTNIRTFPTHDASLSEPDDWEFDLFQETAVGPAEPVLILHHSLDGQWLLVQAYNYNGWMPAEDVAVAASRSIWLDYLRAENFLVVTGNRLKLGLNPDAPELSELELTMGAKMPLTEGKAFYRATGGADDGQSAAGNYTVSLPVRDTEGALSFKLAQVPVSGDISVGFLPYTRANVIRQAFKILGERYGWGGMFNARDCSAFVMDVYKSFGLMLPRNGDEQELSAGRAVPLDGLGPEERSAAMDTLLPGATLHTPTHEMLYLGEHEGRYYVIHDVTSLGDVNNKNADGSLGRLVLNQVAVTDLFLPRRNGQRLIDALTSAKQLESEKAPGGVSSIEEIRVYVDSVLIAFPDQSPFLDPSVDRVYVPLRFVSEAMGAKVEWSNEERKIRVSKAGKEITFTVGEKRVEVDGSGHALDAPVSLVNDRAMVPLRYVSEVLGAEVIWSVVGGVGRVDIRTS